MSLKICSCCASIAFILGIDGCNENTSPLSVVLVQLEYLTFETSIFNCDAITSIIFKTCSKLGTLSKSQNNIYGISCLKKRW
jgi:hypothetical protein